MPWQPYADNINSVVVEDGVTHIGSLAFYYCSKVNAIILPNSVTSIGDNILRSDAVRSSEIMFLVVPPSVVEVSENVFLDASKNSYIVVFGKSDTQIEAMAILNGLVFVEIQFNEDGSPVLSFDELVNLAFNGVVEQYWISATAKKSTVTID